MLQKINTDEEKQILGFYLLISEEFKFDIIFLKHFIPAYITTESNLKTHPSKRSAIFGIVGGTFKLKYLNSSGYGRIFESKIKIYIRQIQDHLKKQYRKFFGRVQLGAILFE
ncbi:hypothetical protein BpHYR1_012123 [Brachionus plicatilis]|uniref:Uncharacterized protein n=1 Tax=Brachionus plicatilis TaxID=10195 RepID=A0A3M7SZP9_BRAPC|nr:hypothetical protein BpHYR1_012123 [Brachionus plicatilis]